MSEVQERSGTAPKTVYVCDASSNRRRVGVVGEGMQPRQRVPFDTDGTVRLHEAQGRDQRLERGLLAHEGRLQAVRGVHVGKPLHQVGAGLARCRARRRAVRRGVSSGGGGGAPRHADAATSAARTNGGPVPSRSVNLLAVKLPDFQKSARSTRNATPAVRRARVAVLRKTEGVRRR
jgi:hypothetical protein